MSLSLREFIETSLTEICEAVENVRASKPYVAEQSLVTTQNEDATNVHFDVAVTVEEQSATSSEGGGRVGIKVVGFQVGVGAEQGREAASSSSSISRVQVSVPVHFRYNQQEAESLRRRNNDAMQSASGGSHWSG